MAKEGAIDEEHTQCTIVAEVATSLLQSVGAVADEAGMVVVQTIIVKRF